MSIVVFGPGMESRSLLLWPLRPIDSSSLTALEVLVQRTGHEICGKSPVAIIGTPWVNPRGRGRAFASIDDYLNDPLSLYRALAVAFKASQPSCAADGAVVATDVRLGSQLSCVQPWVMARLEALTSPESVVWYVFDPEFEACFSAGSGQQSTEALPNLVRDHPLPSPIPAIRDFCENLHSLFK